MVVLRERERETQAGLAMADSKVGRVNIIKKTLLDFCTLIHISGIEVLFFKVKGGVCIFRLNCNAQVSKVKLTLWICFISLLE